MRRTVGILGVFIGVAVLAASCRQYLPQNRYLKVRSSPIHSTADARGKLDHARHGDVFAKAGITCLDCHRFDALVDVSDPAVADRLDKIALYPSGAGCHFCHRGEESIYGAPGECTTCHEDLTALRPIDHEVAWLKVHASMARNDTRSCENCHRQAECINCHQRRDSIQTVVHERNFRFFHAVEARANPMRCGSCHREDFCIRCHQRGGVEGLR